MLTEKQIQKFKQLYQARFGREISNEFAAEAGTRLVTMMRVVYRPLPRSSGPVRKFAPESQMISAMEE
jgi:hypothetical protein